MKIYSIHFEDSEGNTGYVFSTDCKEWAENYVNAYNKRYQESGKSLYYYYETITIAEDI